MRSPNDQKALYYSPSAQSDIASGATQTLTFEGLGGQIYAWNRMDIGCDDMSKLNQLTATATVKTEDGDTDLFKDVQLEALHRLFEYHSLRGGLIIGPNKQLKVSITNNDAASLNVNMNLVGYDEPAYQQKKEQWKQRYGTVPKPVFVYATETISAGADQQSVTIERPNADVLLKRVIVSSESDSDLKISLNIDNTDVMPERYLRQVNHQFQPMDIIEDIQIPKHVSANALATNRDGATAYQLSIIGEAYKVNS